MPSSKEMKIILDEQRLILDELGCRQIWFCTFENKRNMTGHKQHNKYGQSGIITLQETRKNTEKKLQKLDEKYSISPSVKTSSRC